VLPGWALGDEGPPAARGMMAGAVLPKRTRQAGGGMGGVAEKEAVLPGGGVGLFPRIPGCFLYVLFLPCTVVAEKGVAGLLESRSENITRRLSIFKTFK